MKQLINLLIGSVLIQPDFTGPITPTGQDKLTPVAGVLNTCKYLQYKPAIKVPVPLTLLTSSGKICNLSLSKFMSKYTKKIPV